MSDSRLEESASQTNPQILDEFLNAATELYVGPYLRFVVAGCTRGGTAIADAAD
jgi:hypothetical protein